MGGACGKERSDSGEKRTMNTDTQHYQAQQHAQQPATQQHHGKPAGAAAATSAQAPQQRSPRTSPGPSPRQQLGSGGADRVHSHSSGSPAPVEAREVPVRPYTELGSRFELKAKPLGEGAYAKVYLGVDRASHAERAVKVINLAKIDPREEQWMLINEIEILKKVNHPNVVGLYEIFQGPKNLALVVDYCRGGELFEEIVKRQHYSESVASRLLAQLISAVGYLHSLGVVHRDIKPENLLLSDTTDNARLQLTDFGLSAITRNSDMSMFVGTPQYMAPEVIDGREYLSPVDMWSVGVVMFVLLGGYLPFDHDDEDELFRLIHTGKPAYHLYPSLWATISSSARDLLSKLFVVNPKKRLTARQALEHPWLRDQADTAPLAATLENLARYNARRRLKAAMNVARALGRFRAAMKSMSSADADSP